MNKITPEIFNGSLELVLSETVCCNPKYGLQVHIPVTSEKIAQFHFRFESDSDPSKKGCATSQEGEVLIITLTNFLSSLGASLSKPLEFCIGDDKFFLQFYGAASGSDCLCLTISVFKGQKNV
ncbi:MAG: DUF6864 domain-containing function [Parachlamydiales bacterium]|jgi:hypothetical protein